MNDRSEKAGRSKMNGEQIGRLNHGAFVRWMTERGDKKDWVDWVRRGELNRSAIAEELGFDRKAFYTNKDIEGDFHALDTQLREAGILPVLAVNINEPDQPELGSAPLKKILAANHNSKQAIDAQRIRSLEHDNAALREQVKVLTEALARYETLQDALERTGRIPR